MTSQVIDDLRRFLGLIFCMCLIHIIYGLSSAISGPTLPYLKVNVGQTFTTMGFIFTARSVGFVLSSLLTGFSLRHFRHGWQRLFLTAVGLLIVSAALTSVAFINHIGLLITAFAFIGAGGAMSATVNFSLMVLLLGPVRSAPFIQALQFMTAIGCLLTPLLCRPFLPATNRANASEVCDRWNDSASLVKDDLLRSLEAAQVPQSTHNWPYFIAAALTLLLGVVVFIYAGRRPPMKRFLQESSGDEQKAAVRSSRPRPNSYLKPLLLGLFILFSFIHSGTENIFWSHSLTFGLCSDLSLDPKTAALLTSTFFAGFVIGRGSAVFFASCIRPAKLLGGELILGVLVSAVFAIWAESSAPLMFVMIALYGFAISMVCGCGICWLAEQVDMTGAVSSAGLSGSHSGISTVPLLAGAFFDLPVGAMGIMYMTFANHVVLLVVFISMCLVAKLLRTSESANEDRDEALSLGCRNPIK